MKLIDCLLCPLTKNLSYRLTFLFSAVTLDKILDGISAMDIPYFCVIVMLYKNILEILKISIIGKSQNRKEIKNGNN